MNDLSKEILKSVMPEPPAPKPRTESPMDHWSPAVLLERGAYLKKMAANGNGSAGETLKQFPNHAAILSFRARDGEAEIHDNFADIFYVLAGGTTLITGGTVQGARITAPGETRGDSIEGGSHQELRVGDMAHVPAGLPHQMLVSGEKTMTCIVIKIQEKM